MTQTTLTIQENPEWVLMAKALRGELSGEEEQTFAAWLNEDEAHAQLWAEASEAWEETGAEQKITFEPNVQLAWESFCAKTDFNASPATATVNGTLPEEGAKVIPLFPWKNIYRYAAAFILAAGLSWIGYLQLNAEPEWSQVATLSGERIVFYLPDSSQVTLNGNSILRYQTAFSGEERRVELSGEGFFDVKKNPEKPFIIQSGNATTTVLGTSFNVRALPAEKEVSVAVVTGKVTLASAQDGQQVLLTPGFTGTLAENGKISKQETQDNLPNWRTLSFSSASLDAVAAQLEAYFNTSLNLTNKDLANCSFTGSFDNPQLQEILTVLAASNDLKITKTSPSTYSITGTGCQ